MKTPLCSKLNIGPLWIVKADPRVGFQSLRSVVVVVSRYFQKVVVFQLAGFVCVFCRVRTHFCQDASEAAYFSTIAEFWSNLDPHSKSISKSCLVRVCSTQLLSKNLDRLPYDHLAHEAGKIIWVFFQLRTLRLREVQTVNRLDAQIACLHS